ncbi:MAG: fibronectin type III domain-containing protein, partial [Desulfobacteraceae bacterium]
MKASCCLFFLLLSLVIPSENFFPYENAVQAGEISSADASIENKLLVYTPQEMLSFNIEDYLLQNAPHLVEYAETISHWCGYSSISPKIIIALIEYQTGLISNKQPDLNDMQKPLSSLSDSTGFSMQVKDVAAQLADGYYSWRKNQQPSDQNILENFLDQKSNVQLKAQQQNFRNLYYQLFPEISESGDAQQLQSLVYGAAPTDNFLQLPYPVGESWNYGGSHTYNGSGDYPQSSLDFNGGSWSWGTDTSDLWVVAAHGGQVVVHSSCNVEVVGSDGWSTTYYHLDNVVVETDQTVTRNTPLANYADNSAQALCQGGSSSGPHVHFSLKYDGSYEHLDGVKLSGFSVHTGRDSYDSDCDYFWLEKNGTKYCAWTNLENPGVGDTCSVPASLDATDIEETTATLNWESVSSAQSYDIRYKATLDNSWFSTSSSTNSVAISGLTADTEYEFQVRTVCPGETSDYSSSAYFTTYDGVSLKTVGETTVFSTTTNAANRRAVRYAMPEDGTIESITMYHKAGSGDMILGIYDGEDDPDNLLGKTDSVEVSGSDGWQTVELQSSVFVSGGEAIWLAWVLETNDGILVYEAGDDPRSDAGVGWSDGMPDSFGSSSLANYDASIYASYTPGAIQECVVPSGLDATDIEETSAILNWGTVSAAQSYDIRYKKRSDSSWISTSSSTDSVMINDLTAETEYEFQVRAVCSDGTSDYSSSANFTTLAANQECSVPSGIDATDIEETSATLNWGTVSSAQSYDIRYKECSDSSWISTSSSTNSVMI